MALASCGFDGKVILYVGFAVKHVLTPPTPPVLSDLEAPMLKVPLQKLLSPSRDQLCFLRRRASILVSASAGGGLFFWNVHSGAFLGRRNVTSSPMGGGRDGVTAMVTEGTNSFLLCGDALGRVHSFDVSQLDASCKPGGVIDLYHWAAHEGAVRWGGGKTVVLKVFARRGMGGGLVLHF